MPKVIDAKTGLEVGVANGGGARMLKSFKQRPAMKRPKTNKQKIEEARARKAAGKSKAKAKSGAKKTPCAKATPLKKSASTGRLQSKRKGSVLPSGFAFAKPTGSVGSRGSFSVSRTSTKLDAEELKKEKRKYKKNKKKRMNRQSPGRKPGARVEYKVPPVSGR